MDNYYIQIKEHIINNEIYSKVKDYSKERHKIATYFEIGKLLSEAGKNYGEGIIKKYSIKLTNEFGKGYTSTNLKMMRKFYIFTKSHTVCDFLSWSHYRLLLSLNEEALNYYIKIVIEQNLSVRQLQEKIKSNEYERLPNETKEKLINKDNINVKDLVPNPIFLKTKNNNEINTEKALHQLILENIEIFMKELGSSFSFIGSEYKIKIGDRNNHIDLLLFNIKYNSYVVIELKVTEFKVEYIAQVQKYMNYIDKNIKEITNNNTIGIIICKKENNFVIEYCSDEKIIIRQYQLI